MLPESHQEYEICCQKVIVITNLFPKVKVVNNLLQPQWLLISMHQTIGFISKNCGKSRFREWSFTRSCLILSDFSHSKCLSSLACTFISPRLLTHLQSGRGALTDHHGLKHHRWRLRITNVCDQSFPHKKVTRSPRDLPSLCKTELSI